ncbi:hypothetical protein [Streptomyces sp. Ru73]|nr:hypothetical protein [Streptomyces sp. Ru73]
MLRWGAGQCGGGLALGFGQCIRQRFAFCLGFGVLVAVCFRDAF